MTQVEARRQLLKKAGRCFVCLRTGHISKECRSKGKCNKCGRRHHTSICMEEKNETPKTAGNNEGAQQGMNQVPPSTSNEPSDSKLNVNAPSFTSKQKTTSLCLIQQDSSPSNSIGYHMQPKSTNFIALRASSSRPRKSTLIH